jgi:hypothetical protein
MRGVVMAPVGASAPAAAPHKAMVVSVDDARAILQRVLPAGLRDLTYEGTKDRPGMRVHVFSGPDASGAVDVSDGHIAMLGLTVPSSTGPETVSAADAQTIATTYLRSIGSPVDELSAEVRGATGSGTPGYTVTFTRMKGSISLPDYRVVEVDCVTGMVFSLVDVRPPFEDPRPPAIDAAAAKAAAVVRAAGSVALDPQLTVSWDVQGNQRLVWIVPVESSAWGAPGAIITIDAETGDPIELTR